MMTCGGMEDMYDQEVMNEKTVSSRGMDVLLIPYARMSFVRFLPRRAPE